jgi:pyridinium-3,5-biscarboxylic acid mononucleotide synthase
MKNRLEEVLQQVKKGEIEIKQALEKIRDYPYQDLQFAKIDHHRELRKGAPEVVFGLGKSADQIRSISRAIIQNGSNLLVTKIPPLTYDQIRKDIPEAEYNREAQVMYYKQTTPKPGKGKIAVITAGTSDVPVAEEAAITGEVLGNDILRIYDIGVAGLHRLFGEYEKIRKCRVIITVAGMEGALPSVIAGITHLPIIAVPTSIGYGANLNGMAALLAMLNSCPGGVAVVNIDNGFGSAYMANLINHLD